MSRITTTMNLLPVRCYTCGAVIGQYQSRWEALLQLHTVAHALQTLGIRRPCCRMYMMCSVGATDPKKLA